MRTKIFIAFLIGTIFSSGCVRSLQPFYENKDVYFERSLVGIWIDPDGLDTWKIVARDDSSYVIDQTDEEGRRSRFEARLFKIGRRSFIDLVPVPAGDLGGDTYFDNVLPGHTFLAIKTDGCTAKMRYLDPAWLRNFLAANPDVIGHATIGGEIVFTDHPKKLQLFIKRHLDKPGAFEQTETLFKQGDTQCEQRTS